MTTQIYTRSQGRPEASVELFFFSIFNCKPLHKVEFKNLLVLYI